MARTQTDDHAIVLHGATMQLGERTLWHDVNMNIRQGEFIAVLGPNGSGKTTFMRVLLGLSQLTGGDVHVMGQPPRRGNPHIGYVPQRRTLDPDLPVRGRDLVQMGMEGLHWGFWPSSKADRRVIDDAIKQVEATHYANRPIGRMSGGEQQRLLLAQALVGGPRLLLLDEPLANLDLRNQEAITQLIARVARTENLTVLLVTHDINPMLPVMDRVVYIARGDMVIGLPDEIITSETLSVLYGAPVQVIRDSQGRYLCSGTIQ